MNAKAEHPTDSPNFDRNTELLLAMLDNALDGAEFDSLVERLRNEPALRRQALALAGDEETLHQWATTSPDLPEVPIAPQTTLPGSDGEPDSIVAPSMPPERNRRWSWPLAALAASAACVLTIVVFGPRLVREPGRARELATLSRNVNVVWTGEAPPGVRSRLTPGQRLAILSGQAEITYDNGIRVWLQGPVTARLLSGRSIEVTRGTVAIDVGGDSRSPKAGDLFAVVTPKARIVDLGTRFTVSVEESGEIELVVYEGAVRTESLVASETTPIECSSGTAVRIDPETASFTPSAGLEAKFSALKQRLYEQVVPAAADHYVRGGQYRTEVDQSGGGPGGDTLLLKTHRGYDVVRKAWTRFDLSAVDCDADGPAAFVFRHNEPAEEHDFRGTLAVFALRPGYQPMPPEQGLRWKEEELTWQNAPGNDRDGRLVQEEHCLRLGEIDVNSRAADESRGTAYEVAIARLDDVVQEDGSVTIILCVLSQDGHGPNLAIAATGNQEIAGPEMIVSLVQP